MLSLQGQFTFTADRPQLHCAAFFISEPEEFIAIRYDLVSIDCQRGDFLKVRRPGCGARRRKWVRGYGADDHGAQEVLFHTGVLERERRSGTPTRCEARQFQDPYPEGQVPGTLQLKFPSVHSQRPGASKDLNLQQETLC